MPGKSRLADGAWHLALIGGNGASLSHSVRRHPRSPIRVLICDCAPQ